MKRLILLLLLSMSIALGAKAQSQCMSIQLDGVNEYLHTAYSNYAFNNFTIELWIKVPTYSTNIHYVSMYQNAYLVLGDYDAGSFSTWADGLNPIDAGASSLIGTVNVWHHVAFTYDGSAQKIYIDGVLDRNRPTTGSVNLNPGFFNLGLNIGARYDASVQFVNGLFDEVRIWNVARSQAQIQAAMNQELVGNETGLVSYWPMNDGPGSTIASDLTVNNRDLTLINMEPSLDWVNQCPFISVPPFTLLNPAADTICPGDTLTLSVSGRDSVVWTPSGFLSVDTGNVVQYYPQTSGTLVILGWNTGSSTPDTLEVNVLVLPSQQDTVSGSICAGDSLFAGGAWQSTSGTYVDTYTNMHGCDSVVTTQLIVNPNFTTTRNDTICQGDSIMVGGQFQTTAGVYTDALSSVNGCDSIVMTTLAVTVVDTSVTVAGNTLTANAAQATYQWWDCNLNAPVGVTTQSFTSTNAGLFSVIVTQGGCSAESPCYAIFPEGIQSQGLENAVTLYPNPAHDAVNVAFELAQDGASYLLYDELGRAVGRGEIAPGVTKSVISLQSLSPGIYFLQIRMAAGVGSFKLEKL